MPSSVKTRILCALRIVESRCAITNVVRFFASFSRDSCTTFSLSLSSAEVASSKIRTGGFFKNTLAMESRCYHGGEGRTRMNVLKFGRGDGVAAAAFAVLTALTIAAQKLLP